MLLTGSFLLCLIKSCNDRSGNADVIDEAFWGIDMYLTIEGVSSHATDFPCLERSDDREVVMIN